MTKTEKQFNELLPEYKAAYKAANGREVSFEIEYKGGFVWMLHGSGNTKHRLSKFREMITTLKERAANKEQ